MQTTIHKFNKAGFFKMQKLKIKHRGLQML